MAVACTEGSDRATRCISSGQFEDRRELSASVRQRGCGRVMVGR